MRKRCHRRRMDVQPPRGLRRKLAPEQVRDLAIAHHTHVDLVVTGKATIDTVWEMAGAALGWSFCAQSLGIGEPEMAADLQVIAAVLERWQRTGRVGYSGQELQQARIGREVVDELARTVDLYTALVSVNRAEDEINRRRALWESAMDKPHVGRPNVQNHSTMGRPNA